MFKKTKRNARLLTLPLLASFILAATLALPTLAASKKINLKTPEGQLMAMRKDTCSLIDGKAILYTWKGAIYSFRRGEADKKLFNVEGMNIRQCGTIDGGKRGEGFHTVSREIMLYLDPDTNEILDKWNNPWLGREVDVLHVTNDPVNFGRGFFARDKNGKPSIHFPAIISDNGKSWLERSTIPLFYHNVLQGAYQKYVGGAYHATEMFSSSGTMDDLLSDSDTTKVHGGGWSRISEYLPWMEMQGREGLLYAHAVTWKVNRIEDLSNNLQRFIKERAPEYRQPPPLDDTRPNVTSWTFFKTHMKGGKLPRGGH